jgi:regulator of replication initiation timing
MALKNKHTRELSAVTQQLKESSQQTHILRSEISELRTGLLSIGKRVLDVEQQNQDLVQQQAAQKYDDPDAKIYSRAVKMVGLGADLDEVIRECELPRAEAELLFSLHKKKGA